MTIRADKLPIPTGDVMADAYTELRDEIVEQSPRPGGLRSTKKAAKRKKKIVRKKKTRGKKTGHLKPRK